MCLKALRALSGFEGVRLVTVGDLRVLRDAADLLKLDKPLRRIDSLDEPRPPGPGIEILHVEMTEPAPRGAVSAAAGRHTLRILETCSRLCLSGEAAGVVTAPVNKESLMAAGHGALGHTERLARLAGVESAETVFCVERLRIFFLTRHLSLREAVEAVRRGPILAALLRMDRAMKSLGLQTPRLGVAGLNPHCGDGGLFGTEDVEEVVPAVAAARQQGVDVQGPIGADSIFHMGLEGAFDAVLSLYHDQGHIAAKTRDFHGTVTLTLGLPYLRTSVDHGTALDIAWQGTANPKSMIRAIELAVEQLSRGWVARGT